MNSDIITQIKLAFAELADPAQAIKMRAYLRDQFDFVGIPTPLRRAAVTALDTHGLDQRALLETVRALWDMPWREYQYAGIDLLAHKKKLLTADVVGPLLDLAQQKPWWETVDGLAGVIGGVMRASAPGVDQPHALMDGALSHPSMWVRRIAMTHQLGWRLQTDSERLFHYARVLAPEQEFFIRKAIGWALRDYAKWNADAVLEFVVWHRRQLSPLTVREALKHHRAALDA
jgi:3-methyladenine DNA glycosylase AlkD